MPTQLAPEFTDAVGSKSTQTVKTGADGAFSTSYKPEKSGAWSVSARFDGDGNLQATSSSKASLTVEEPPITSNPLLYVGVIVVVAASVLIMRMRRSKSKTTL